MLKNEQLYADFIDRLKALNAEYGSVHSTLWNKRNLLNFILGKRKLDYFDLDYKTNKIALKFSELLKEFIAVSNEFPSKFSDLFSEHLITTLHALRTLGDYLSKKDQPNSENFKESENYYFNLYVRNYKGYVKSATALEKYCAGLC